MTYMICYWDATDQVQKERPATDIEIAEIEARIAASTQDPVPEMVTMKQARLALLNAGVLDRIQPVIDALPEPSKTEVNIEWNYSSTVERHNSFCVMLGQAIGLTDAQMDDLFRTAATL